MGTWCVIAYISTGGELEDHITFNSIVVCFPTYTGLLSLIADFHCDGCSHSVSILHLTGNSSQFITSLGPWTTCFLYLLRHPHPSCWFINSWTISRESEQVKWNWQVWLDWFNAVIHYFIHNILYHQSVCRNYWKNYLKHKNRETSMKNLLKLQPMVML